MPITQINPSAASGASSRAKIEITTYKQALTVHKEMLAVNGYPPNAVAMMNIMTTTAVLTTSQLAKLLSVSVQTLRKYQRKGYVISSECPIELRPYQLDRKRGERLWTLGLVGVARAVEMGMAAISFRGYSFKQTTHDVLLNEVVIELLTQAAGKGIKHTWYGTYEGRAYDSEGNVVAEPDAVLKFGHGYDDRTYIVEYHNEPNATRVPKKIERYEGIARSRKYTMYWPTNAMPTIIVVATDKVVLQGYIDELRDRGQSDVRCRYLGKSYERFADDRQKATQWSDLNAIAFDEPAATVTLF